MLRAEKFCYQLRLLIQTIEELICARQNRLFYLVREQFMRVNIEKILLTMILSWSQQ